MIRLWHLRVLVDTNPLEFLKLVAGAEHCYFRCLPVHGSNVCRVIGKDAAGACLSARQADVGVHHCVFFVFFPSHVRADVSGGTEAHGIKVPAPAVNTDNQNKHHGKCHKHGHAGTCLGRPMQAGLSAQRTEPRFEAACPPTCVCGREGCEQATT